MTRVLAGGCFNRIHEGHVYFLKEAKKLGTELIIVLANEGHNKKPYASPAEERRENMQGLSIADKIVVGDADGFVGTVYREKPDVIALGYDQRLPPDVESRLGELRVRVVRIGKLGDHATSSLAAAGSAEQRPR